MQRGWLSNVGSIQVPVDRAGAALQQRFPPRRTSARCYVTSDFCYPSLSIRASTASPTLSTAPPVMPNMLKILRAHARNEVTDASRWARWNFDVRRKAPGCPSVESHRGRSGLRWQAKQHCYQGLNQGRPIRRGGQEPLSHASARFSFEETDVTDGVRPHYLQTRTHKVAASRVIRGAVCLCVQL